MDWTAFFGNTYNPYEGQDENDSFRPNPIGGDSYAPTADQRRRILDQALRALGSGMVQAAFSPTWGGFGTNFNKGLSDYAQARETGEEYFTKQNQDRARFDQQMEQERIQTQRNRLSLKQDTEDDQIKDAIRRQGPNIINSLDQTVNELFNKELDPSDQTKMDVFRTQWKAAVAIAKEDPGRHLSGLYELSSKIADLAGERDAFEEAGKRALGTHAYEAGWMNPDGTPDIDGMIAWQQKQRQHTEQTWEEQSRYNEARIGATNRRNTGKGKRDKGTYSPGDIERNVKEMKKTINSIQTDNEGGFFRADVDKLKTLGLNPIINRETGVVSLNKQDQALWKQMKDDTWLKAEAERRLKGYGYKAPDEAESEDNPSEEGKEGSGRLNELKKLMGTKLPSKEQMANQPARQQAIAKAKMKKAGLTDDEIKVLYGI